MDTKEKGILINRIIGYLRENVEERNKKLREANLWSDQKKFDAGDMFFTLAFMADDDVKRIASLILK